ncbi:MAG: hypothetical protein J7M12_01420, partial [Candidatus Hydrogenedentes bacterium]|nr:hypothetical protein [Candidatus Hydrogenedentota bacterium]
MFDLNLEQMFHRLEEYAPVFTKMKHAVRQATTDRQRLREIERVVNGSSWTDRTRDNDNDGPRALFLSPRFWPIHQGWELTFAWMAAQAGYRPHFLGCGAITPICDAYRVEHHLGMYCDRCTHMLRHTFETARMPHEFMADYIGDYQQAITSAQSRTDSLSLAELLAFTHDGSPIGEWIKNPLIRYLRRELTDDEQTVAAARMFLAGALVIYDVASRVLDQNWDIVFMLCGKFLHERVFYELARRRGIDVFVYERGYLADTLVMGFNSFVNEYEIGDAWPRLVSMPLTDEQLNEVDRYMAVRRTGDRSSSVGKLDEFWPKIKTDHADIRDDLNLGEYKQINLLCSNIVWDTAAIGRETAFTGLFDWVRFCIGAVRDLDDSLLVIRVHPAEVRRKDQPTLDRLEDMIRREFPELPENVRVVPAESPISTYALGEIADRVLVYTSTIGIETARLGKEVVVCGRTHYARKGFTLDIDTQEQLRD